MAAELVQLSRSLFDDLSEHDLTTSQTLVYLGLRCNPNITGHGLYEISVGRLARLIGLSAELVRNDLQILGGLGLVIMDNGLVFVDRIPADGRFATWGQKHKSLKAGIKRYRAIRSAVGGDNTAFMAWLEYHAELLADLDDTERIECGLTPSGLGAPPDSPTIDDYPDPVALPNPSFAKTTQTLPVPFVNPSTTLCEDYAKSMQTPTKAPYTDTDEDTDEDEDAFGKMSDLYGVVGGAGDQAARSDLSAPHAQHRNGTHAHSPP